MFSSCGPIFILVKITQSNSLWSCGLYSPWNSPGQNTGVGCRSPLRGIFPAQGSNPGLLHCKWILYQLNPGLTSQVICLLSEVAQSCPTLCDPMDCSLPGSSVHGILQAVVLEWIAISFSRGPSQPRARTQVSRIVYRLFTVWATRESICLLLCYILDFSGNSQFRSLLLFQSYCNHRNRTQCLESW